VERPDDRVPSALRFSTELVAWIGVPWALSGHSWPLAVLSLVVLIGLPSVFTTPGDKAHVLVAVPGWVTILLVLLQIAGALVAAWWIMPLWAAVPVSVLAVATLVAERPRWTWLLTLPARAST
jgi:hypothetical protein